MNGTLDEVSASFVEELVTPGAPVMYTETAVEARSMIEQRVVMM